MLEIDCVGKKSFTNAVAIVLCKSAGMTSERPCKEQGRQSKC